MTTHVLATYREARLRGQTACGRKAETLELADRNDLDSLRAVSCATCIRQAQYRYELIIERLMASRWTGVQAADFHIYANDGGPYVDLYIGASRPAHMRMGHAELSEFAVAVTKALEALRAREWIASEGIAPDTVVPVRHQLTLFRRKATYCGADVEGASGWGPVTCEVCIAGRAEERRRYEEEDE